VLQVPEELRREVRREVEAAEQGRLFDEHFLLDDGQRRRRFGDLRAAKEDPPAGEGHHPAPRKHGEPTTAAALQADNPEQHSKHRCIQERSELDAGVPVSGIERLSCEQR